MCFHVTVGEAGDQTRKSQMDDQVAGFFLRAKEGGEKPRAESVKAMSSKA